MGAERVFELARHLTERDREVALCLYEQQVLTTDQLTLLFFSSRRRAQDRLLFLYRERVADRFYPPSRFGAGKPQAHWLLDEASAFIVAASLDLDRKQLGWQRRDDWRSHSQLAHRLEANRFVTDLVAATLPDPALGVGAWYGTRQAAARLSDRIRSNVRPDAELLLLTPAGTVDLLLEWDRGTETQERLEEKLRRYRLAEHKLRYQDPEPRSVLFVLPGVRRLQALRETGTAALAGEPGWPILATTTAELRRGGPLAPVWQRLDRDQPARSLTALPVRADLGDLEPGLALGRRWRHERPDFWQRLSPLGRALTTEALPAPQLAPTTPDSARRRSADVANRAGATSHADAELRHPEASEGLLAMRRWLQDEIRQDVAAARAASRIGTTKDDLRQAGVDGSMDDPEAKEGSWR